MTELNTNTNQRKDEEVTSTINEEENEGSEVNDDHETECKQTKKKGKLINLKYIDYN